MMLSAGKKDGHWLPWIMAPALLLFMSTLCYAAIADIADDLREVNGYVVTVRDGEIIIDLDESNGISTGDIFSVMGPGEELIHPVTNKAIGRLEKVKGVLRVVRLGEGFSFARAIDDAGNIKRGDQIRRFGGLKAIFWDYSGNNKQLYDSLQGKLPALKWEDYRIAQTNRPAKPSPLDGRKDALIFVADRHNLEVLDADLSPVRKYALNGNTSSSDEGTMPALLPTPSKTAKVKKEQIAGKSEAKAPVNVDYGETGAISQLQNNTLMTDLLHHDGHRLLATTDGKTISIVDMDDNFQLLAEAGRDTYERILALKWWQPTGGNSSFLTVLAWKDERIDSSLYIFAKDKLTSVASGLRSILGSFDLDNDGRRETLLSQEFDAENFFGRRIREAYLQDSQIVYKSLDLVLPPKFTVIGGQIADLTGDGELECAYIRNGVLWIYSGKKQLYASPKQMGGSLSVLTYKVDPTLLDYRSTSVFFEIAPIAADIDGDGRKELLAVSSDQSFIKAPGIGTTIDQSRIVVFNHENGAFSKGMLGEPIEAAIQGLDVSDGQLLFVATEISPLLGRAGGNSRLQSLQLPF